MPQGRGGDRFRYAHFTCPSAYTGNIPNDSQLSQADVDTLRSYVEQLRAGKLLNPSKVRDYRRITEIVIQVYPQLKNAWLLYLVGEMLGEITAINPEPDDERQHASDQ